MIGAHVAAVLHCWYTLVRIRVNHLVELGIQQFAFLVAAGRVSITLARASVVVPFTVPLAMVFGQSDGLALEVEVCVTHEVTVVRNK